MFGTFRPDFSKPWKIFPRLKAKRHIISEGNSAEGTVQAAEIAKFFQGSELFHSIFPTFGKTFLILVNRRVTRYFRPRRWKVADLLESEKE